MYADSVYVSYARKAEKDQPVVDQLTTACKNKELALKIDTEQIKYGESIQEYMRELSAGKHIILIISDSYFKSRFCMEELLGIYNNEQFHKRTYPIILSGTEFHDPIKQVDYLKHWEDEKRLLNEKLRVLDGFQNIEHIQKTLNLYSEFRRTLDGILEVLGVMNALTKDIHIDTDFEALLNRILVQQAKNEDIPEQSNKLSYEKYREQIIGNVREILEKNKRLESALQTEGIEQGIEVKDMARYLCEGECKHVINTLLSPATEKSLRNIPEPKREETWNAAESLLANLCQLAIDKELVIGMERNGENSGDYGFEMSVKTPFGVEIISSCYRRKSPKLKGELGESRVAGNDAIFEPEIETGWDDDHALDAMLREIWKNVFPEDKEVSLNKKFSEDELESLNETLRLRESRVQFHHYIPVNSEAQQKRLLDPKFYEKLKTKLKNITVIYFNSTEKYVQCIPDENLLMVAVREFLQIGKKS